MNLIIQTSEPLRQSAQFTDGVIHLKRWHGHLAARVNDGDGALPFGRINAYRVHFKCESRVEKGRQTAQKSRECKYVANKSHKALLRCL